MVAIASPPITVETFEQMPDSGQRWELIKGELVKLNAASSQHGAICGQICHALLTAVKPRQLGRVFVSDAGFLISTDPATVRVPDVSFVSAARLPAMGDVTRIARIVPDLVVEVVSLSDVWKDVWLKAAMWLNAGVSLVWVVDPEAETVVSLAADAPSRHFAPGDILDAGALIPDFQLPVADIFPD